MKKIELNLDALQVESFAIGAGKEERGTVMGNQRTQNVNCYTQEVSCYRTACCPATFRC
jgi:hypothetical protein